MALVGHFFGAYTPGMDQRPSEPIDVEYEQRDLIDRYPRLGRATSQLERSLGPSCILSLVIAFLVLVVVRRFVNFGWIGTAILALVIWYGVISLLVRWPLLRSDSDQE